MHRERGDELLALMVDDTQPCGKLGIGVLSKAVEGPNDLIFVFVVEDQVAGIDVTLWKCFVIEASNDPKVRTSATQGLEQVGMRSVVDIENLSTSHNNFIVAYIVAGPPASGCEEGYAACSL